MKIDIRETPVKGEVSESQRSAGSVYEQVEQQYDQQNQNITHEMAVLQKLDAAIAELQKSSSDNESSRS